MFDNQLSCSVSKIPPRKLISYPIFKQSTLSNLIFGKLFKRLGISQIMTYHRTRKRQPVMTYPYMPEPLPEDARLFDFHFHSFYSDGQGTFKDILNEIHHKKHLNGMTITDHPYHLGKDLNDKIPTEKVIAHSYDFQDLIKRFKKKGKLSQEFTSFPGSCEFFTNLDEKSDSEVELIALGVSRDFIQKNGGIKRLTNQCHAVELIEKIHDDNGLVILPHPFFFTRAHELLERSLTSNARPDAVEAINYTTGFFYDEGFHGFLEKLPFSIQTKSVANNFGYFNWIASIVCEENDYGKYFYYPLARQLATVGSSDAHFHSMIGAASTMITDPVENLEDLRAVFRNKRSQPILNPIWKKKTRKSEVYREIWNAYGDLINDGIKERPYYQWVLAKTIVDITRFFFD